MQETAVGLFDNAGVADSVVDSLRAHGIPSNGIRVISSTNGTKSDGFGAGFATELSAMGVSEYEKEAYLAGLRRGNVLVFATGSRQQAAEALTIMNEFAALEIDAFATAGVGKTGAGKAAVTGTGDLGTINPEPKLPESPVTIGEHEHSYTSHASRSKTEGARVFTW
jgi:hypothetical protein